MDDIRLTLPEIDKAFVDAQVAEGDYASPAEYVAALIHAEAKAKAQEKLEALLLEGLEGDDIEWTDADWDKLRSRIAAR
jgi:antitoxin ParD1/3/4